MDENQNKPIQGQVVGKKLFPQPTMIKPGNNRKEHSFKVPENREVKIPTANEPEKFRELFGFDAKDVNVLICTPCYGGSLYVGYLHSMIQTANLMNHTGIKYALKTVANESLINRARNTCTSYFLSHPEFTHLLFIDSDITWKPDTIIKLLRAKKDVISAVYPKKSIVWNKLVNVVDTAIKQDVKNIKTIDQGIEAKLLDYVVNFKDPEHLQMQANCIEVKDAPTGFMLIDRKIFDKLIAMFGEKDRYNNDLALPMNEHKPDSFYNFFSVDIDDEDRRLLSEDYAFCRKVQKAGGSIWIEITSPLTHTGTYNFHGNIMDILEMKP